ncbi:MAG: class I SAM-dependent methyltransferase [Candidatus Uhrbacteria bacterium]|nr:class I SAM-dependent methyltransferase [Candidatus Uhrbacteria bacterium]
MSKRANWLTYYANTKNRPPSDLLVKALEYVSQKGRAIDIGGGALKDSRYLLQEGFEVINIDSQKLPADFTRDIDKERFQHVVSSFEKYVFPKEAYDLASAMYALPFNRPETFDRVFEDVKKSLRVQGILCGNFFGDRDSWANDPKMTFHTLDRAKASLADLEVLFFKEREWGGMLADGVTKKHWHIFEFIARRQE